MKNTIRWVFWILQPLAGSMKRMRNIEMPILPRTITRSVSTAKTGTLTSDDTASEWRENLSPAMVQSKHRRMTRGNEPTA